MKSLSLEMEMYVPPVAWFPGVATGPEQVTTLCVLLHVPLEHCTTEEKIDYYRCINYRSLINWMIGKNDRLLIDF